jgi:hypothetical protein
MKTKLLNIIAAASLVAIAPARSEEKKDEKSTSGNASSSVTANVDGTATVTVDVNGKKETRTFKLGDGKPFSIKVKDGDVAVGGGAAAQAEPAKKVKVTWLGVAAEPVSDEVRAQLPLKEGEGLLVTHVAPDSPAAKAGIEQHDIITRFDSQILVSAEQLKSLVKMHKPGDKVKITALRKGLSRDSEAALDEHEVSVGRDDQFGKWLDAPGFRRLPGRNFLKDGAADNDVHGGMLRKHLKDLKDKFPDIIVDRKAFIVGPDGKTKKLDGDFKMNDVLELMRKHLDEAKLSDDVRDQILKSVEDAVTAGSGFLKDADSGLNELKKEIEHLRKELEKTKGELEKAPETPKP